MDQPRADGRPGRELLERGIMPPGVMRRGRLAAVRGQERGQRRS